MFLSFIRKAEQYFTPSKASASRHPIDHFTPSTLAEAPYDMAPKKSDFPSLKSSEFSQATADQHSLSEIKKKWDKHAHAWPQDIRETVLRLCKLVKANPSNSKAPSSHAIWKMGNWNFGHWVVMNSIYGDNSGSLSNMKYRLKDEFPNINFDDFRGVGLKAAEDGSEDGSEEDGDSQKKTKKRKSSRSPKKSSRSKRRQKSTPSEAPEESSIDREFREKLERGVKKEPRSESKGKTPMPQVQTASSEGFFNNQRQPMDGYGYPNHGYGGQNAYMPMRAAQPMGMMGPMQNVYNVDTTATMHLRQEMNDRLAAQERAHAAEMQRLRGSFEDKLHSAKEEIYTSMNLLVNRLMGLEQGQEAQGR